MRIKTSFLVMKTLASFSVTTCSVLGQTWIQTSAPATYWSKIICSADGARLAAFTASDYVYTSTNAGRSWVSNSLPRYSYCLSTACSSDGSRMIAGMECGVVYTSTNWGASWISNSMPSGNWGAVASSADGSKLIALYEGNLIYTSTNSGALWNSNGVPPPLDLIWKGVACSADGTKLAAAGVQFASGGTFGRGGICISTNSGATWELSGAPNTYWTSIACSADGSKLVAAAYDYGNYPWSGGVYTSTNSGKTWRLSAGGGSLNEAISVACSQDGRKMTAAAYWTGPIYTSIDSGATWKSSSTPTASWSSVANSADGSISVAAGWPGSIYIWEATTTLDIALSGTNHVLSWLSLCDGYQLQKSPDLSVTNWMAVTDAVVCTDGRYRVSLSSSSGRMFYRLQKP
jgi:photosystem II stability/assembly factor-like uncharacterized protein